ncbi:MAG: HAD hydrolase-like protein [Actinomycetota bacterium]|nr:HAD hydrolase-like protein [Actinomycetota bacterium]
MTLKALIFDVDGTLAESEAIHRTAFNLAFSEFGLTTDWDEATYINTHLKTAGGFERLIVAAKSDPQLAGVDLMALHWRKNELYIEMVKSGQLAMKRGVKRLIEAAKAEQIKVAVATTTSIENVATLINSNFSKDLYEVVDFVGAGDVVETKKPSPLIYNYVLDGLGLKLSEGLAIEDSDNGILASTGASLATLVVQSRFSPIEKPHVVGAYVKDLGDDQDRDLLISGPPLDGVVDLDYLRQVHLNGNRFSI